MRRAAGFLLGAVIAACGTTAAAQSQLVVSAGPTDSAVWVAAGDLTVAGQQCGTSIDVQTSEGAMSSLEALHGDGGANAAIVQADVLDYLQSYAGQDPKIAQAVQGVELAASLFRQELHVVARDGVDAMGALDGARVNLGPLTSGGFLTATITLDLLGIQPAEKLRLPIREALAALKAGDLDAVMFVDAAPSRILADAGIEPGSARLLDVEDPFLSEVYQDASILAGTYDFDPTGARSIAVQSYLMTREVPLNTQVCNGIADAVAMITWHRQVLATQGHAKWSDLDQSGPALNWPLSPCAAAGLDQARQLACR